MSSEINQRKFNNQIEIADLIGEAVQNASARRNQAIDAEESFLDMSGEETKAISGGTIGTIRMGYFAV